MAWTAEFSPDSDKAKVGQATATWNKGDADEFSYSVRCDLDSDIGVFAADAKAAKSANDIKATGVSALITSLEAALN